MRSDMQEQITITDRPTSAAILPSVFNVTVPISCPSALAASGPVPCLDSLTHLLGRVLRRCHQAEDEMNADDQTP